MSTKSGTYIASKQMVFWMESRKLEPTNYSTSQHLSQAKEPSRDSQLTNKYPVAEAPTLQTQIVK